MTQREMDDDDGDDEPSSWDDEDADDYSVPCPYCRREIHEDAERCPYCERYISDEDAPASAKPWWCVIGFLLCLFVIYLWIVG